MELIVSLLIGVLFGAIPAIIGAFMEELEIGMIGFVASSVSALLFSFYGAIPVGILFALYIFRHARSKQSSHNELAAVIPFPVKRSRRASGLS
ncbi:hypothetical protein BAMA_09550 [Bacillus manliponensis]|uniref:Uncharacterized protein n=1 Tax=Bacillus manliponensis TaxID=574376 RepID=A0A073K3K0_9BACI|nr:hypothetical protein [Bacillus manliponensis]KEK21027.1 hypothetical protein BAMA_09550 [Bacillus manliponensis]